MTVPPRRRPLVAVTAALVVAACHHAPPATTAAPQAPAADTTTATDSAARSKADSAPQGWTAANLAIGDAVVVVRARYGGRVYVGAGNATQTVTLVADADAVSDFVREARALLPPHKVPRNAPPPVLEEPKSGRALSFGRHISAGKSRYRFFFSDDRLGGFSIPATLVETRAVLAGLARGAALAREAKPDSTQPKHP